MSLVDETRLEELIAHSDAGVAAESRVTLAMRLGIADKSLNAIRAATESFRALMIAAATGSKEGAPDEETAKMWGRHGRRWFKSVAGGHELAEKMFALGVWPSIKPDLLPFLNAVRAALGQAAISDVAHDG